MADRKCKSAASLSLSSRPWHSLFIAAPALAADPIYPIGSRVGLVPPAGMVESDKFVGFDDPNAEAASH